LQSFKFAIEGAQRLDQMMMGLLEYSRVGRKGEPPAWVESRKLLEEAMRFLSIIMGGSGPSRQVKDREVDFALRCLREALKIDDRCTPG